MKSSTILFILLIFVSCKTRPVIYDTNYPELQKNIELVTLLINQSKFSEAETLMETILKKYPDDIQVKTLKLYKDVKTGNATDLLEKGNELLKAHKKNPLLYVILSSVYYQMNDMKNAYIYINQAMKLSQSVPAIFYQKGLIEFSNKDYRQSEMSFNRAYMLDRTNSDAYFFRFISRLLVTSSVNQTKHMWDYFTANFASQSYHYVHLVNALYLLQDTDNTGKMISEALSKFPEDPYLLNFSANLLLSEYRKTNFVEVLETAVSQIEKAIKNTLIPEFADTHLDILYEQGKMTEYTREFKKYEMLYADREFIQKWKSIKADTL